MRVILGMILLICTSSTLSMANGIVYVKNDQIYKRDFVAKKGIKLTAKGRNMSPKVSPDGKYIVFQAIREGHNNYEVYVMSMDGEKKLLRRISYGGSQGAVNPIWSNRGNCIFYYTNKNIAVLLDQNKVPMEYRIVTLDDYTALKNSTKCKSAVQTDDYDCKFTIIPSPDEKYHLLLFHRKIVVYDVLNNKVLFERVYPEGITIPAWSKDSNSVAFIDERRTDTVIVLSVVFGTSKETSLDKQNNQECGSSMSWRNDGKKLAMSCFDVISEKHSVRVFDFKDSEILGPGSSVDWY